MAERPGDIQPKPVRWVGSSKEDLRDFPEEVRRRVGGALWDAQLGREAPYAKPLRGFGGAGVLEIVDDFDGDTYRAVYTVRFAGAVYVLHAFKKKSRRGIATPKAELGLIEQRLKRAKADYEQWSRSDRINPDEAGTEIPVTPSSGNVFADLGFAEPEEELTKAQLASHIRQIIRRRRLTQVAAAALMGIDQPKVSALLNGRLANFSSERLMRLLTTLGQDVEITVKAKPRNRARGRIRVINGAHP